MSRSQFFLMFKCYKSRKENPQKLTQLSSRSHPRHLVGKRTAQKDTIIDITSDSQVNSNFPNRWSSTLANEYPSSNETSKKNGTVRGDYIACDALLILKMKRFNSLAAKKQTTKFSSANFQKMWSPICIILRIERLEGKHCRSR